MKALKIIYGGNILYKHEQIIKEFFKKQGLEIENSHHEYGAEETIIEAGYPEDVAPEEITPLDIHQLVDELNASYQGGDFRYLVTKKESGEYIVVCGKFKGQGE